MKLLRKMHDILHTTNPDFESSEPPGPRSLNIGVRRADLTRIMEENLVRENGSEYAQPRAACRIASPA